MGNGHSALAIYPSFLMQNFPIASALAFALMKNFKILRLIELKRMARGTSLSKSKFCISFTARIKGK